MAFTFFKTLLFISMMIVFDDMSSLFNFPYVSEKPIKFNNFKCFKE